MLPIPSALRTEFEAYLRSRGAPNAEQGAYGKWLRFYLDFCQKYHFPEELRGSLTPFLGKLEEKKQTKAQQLQASQAITLYFDLLQSKDAQSDGRSPRMVSPRGEISDERSSERSRELSEQSESPTFRWFCLGKKLVRS